MYLLIKKWFISQIELPWYIFSKWLCKPNCLVQCILVPTLQSRLDWWVFSFWEWTAPMWGVRWLTLGVTLVRWWHDVVWQPLTSAPPAFWPLTHDVRPSASPVLSPDLEPDPFSGRPLSVVGCHCCNSLCLLLQN